MTDPDAIDARMQIFAAIDAPAPTPFAADVGVAARNDDEPERMRGIAMRPWSEGESRPQLAHATIAVEGSKRDTDAPQREFARLSMIGVTNFPLTSLSTGSGWGASFEEDPRHSVGTAGTNHVLADLGEGSDLPLGLSSVGEGGGGRAEVIPLDRDPGDVEGAMNGDSTGRLSGSHFTTPNDVRRRRRGQQRPRSAGIDSTHRATKHGAISRVLRRSTSDAAEPRRADHLAVDHREVGRGIEGRGPRPRRRSHPQPTHASRGVLRRSRSRRPTRP